MLVYHKILNLTNTQTHCQLVQLDSHCPQRTEQNICLLLCSITFVIPFHLIMPENKSIQSIRVTTNQQVFLCHCCFSCKIMSTNEYWWSVNNYNLLSIAIRSREKKAAAGVGKRQLQIYILPHNSIQLCMRRWRVVWTHSMQQDLIHNQFLSNIFTGNIPSDLSPRS